MIYLKITKMELSQIEKHLISEIKLDPIEAKTFLLVNTEGKMSVNQISKKLGIKLTDALDCCNRLIQKGAFIDLPKNEFEAMHPRFTAVNMYRKMCEQNGIEFKRNKTVDNIGVVLERFYDAARTK